MKRMTVVFDEDALYTAVKVAALERNCALKELVPRILKEWLDSQEKPEPRSGRAGKPGRPSPKARRP